MTTAGFQTVFVRHRSIPRQLKIVRDIVSANWNVATSTPRSLRRPRANCSSARPDGPLVVSHTTGLATDGTDQLRNIERLQFADGSLDHRRHRRATIPSPEAPETT